nr:MAG TPA: hypothetical protein [Bacteriophage sp.]
MGVDFIISTKQLRQSQSNSHNMFLKVEHHRIDDIEQ